MKKLTKWLYLVIVPVLLLIIDICIYMEGQGSVFSENTTLAIGTILIHTAVLMAMTQVYTWDIDMGINLKRLKIEFEKMPIIAFGVGYDRGIVLVIPFVAIGFTLKKRKSKNIVTTR